MNQNIDMKSLEEEYKKTMKELDNLSSYELNTLIYWKKDIINDIKQTLILQKTFKNKHEIVELWNDYDKHWTEDFLHPFLNTTTNGKILCKEDSINYIKTIDNYKDYLLNKE